MTSSAWSPVVSGPDEDFSSFLEFGELQLDFSPFDSSSHDGGNPQDGGDTMDMQPNPSSELLALENSGLGGPSAMGDFDDTIQSFQDTNVQSQQLDHQQLPQHIMYSQQFQLHNIVPPTPNSIEMHKGHMQYHQAASHGQARTMYENYVQTRNAQVCLTSDAWWNLEANASLENVHTTCLSSSYSA